MDNFQEKVAFIWSVADLLRGDYKQSEYGKVILPLTVLRRLDSVLEPTKQKVLRRHEELQGRLENVDPVLEQITGHGCYNVSQFTFPKLLDDPANVAENLRNTRLRQKLSQEKLAQRSCLSVSYVSMLERG